MTISIKSGPEVYDHASKGLIQFGIGSDTKYYARSQQNGSWGLWVQYAEGSAPPVSYDAVGKKWRGPRRLLSEWLNEGEE